MASLVQKQIFSPMPSSAQIIVLQHAHSPTQAALVQEQISIFATYSYIAFNKQIAVQYILAQGCSLAKYQRFSHAQKKRQLVDVNNPVLGFHTFSICLLSIFHADVETRI